MKKIINPFVYDYIAILGMPNATIPAWVHETYSQGYEDVVICSELEAYQLRNKVRLNHENLTYIEVGANHPVATSSTFLLSKTFNVGGYLVEPNPKLAEVLRTFRVNDQIIEAAVTIDGEEEIDFYLCEDNEISSVDKRFVEEWSGITQSFPGVKDKIKVKTININDLLQQVSDKKVVVLTIDVEGLDLPILKNIDLSNHRPYIIVIEPSEAYAPGNTQNMIDYMSDNGYELISANFVNLIFKNKNA